MSHYLFIESRDAFESRDEFVIEMATGLKAQGNEVTVFLVQNGVLSARRNAAASPLPRLLEAGVTTLADDFSLCERGMQEDELLAGIQQTSLDSIVDMLVDQNTKAIWH